MNSTPIEKLLVANRGEIAVRIIRAARELGIRTVAVFSDADANSMHVGLADEAVRIGAGEASESYLDPEKILNAARQTKSNAIHPGYGFLSERASFAQACQDAGFVFIGPPPQAMRLLGSKTAAKAVASKAGVPIVPGFFEPDATYDQLRSAAQAIGFPVLLKASAGGGGRGMRAVLALDEFDSAYSVATSEAMKAFGDSSMMVERLVQRPRHIEVQILADGHGNVACLFERECSIQRRHQKLLEEAPSPLPHYDLLWPAMRQAARSLALAAGYVGAGTVEFIVDPHSMEFFFLEVNARIQVEHPVTEAITGVDLVQWQLRIAAGEELSIHPDVMKGDRRRIVGHAVEVRVVAEDPARDFVPSVGKILAWLEPKAPGVRVDTGFGPGAEIPPHYDSLLAKVISHGESRVEAFAKLRTALLDFHILGVRTNIGLLIDLLDDGRIRSGEYDTEFMTRFLTEWKPGELLGELDAIAGHAEIGSEQNSVFTPMIGAWEARDSFRNIG